MFASRVCSWSSLRWDLSTIKAGFIAIVVLEISANFAENRLDFSASGLFYQFTIYRSTMMVFIQSNHFINLGFTASWHTASSINFGLRALYIAARIPVENWQQTATREESQILFRAAIGSSMTHFAGAQSTSPKVLDFRSMSGISHLKGR